MRRARQGDRAGAACVAALTLALAAGPAHADIATTGTQRELDAAYSQLLQRPHPRYLLPAIELFAAMSIGFTWYWIDRERQVADWDFPSIKDRLTFEAWRFDTNPFPINFAWHAIDGGQYHVVGRSSEL